MAGVITEFIKIAVGFNNAELLKGIAESNKAISGFSRGIKNLMKITGLSFLTKMATDAAALGRNLSIVSQQLGIATSRLSKMQSAFASVGIKAESINGVLTSISEGIAGLAFGEGEFASKLASMGISAWNNQGNEKEADTILGDIAQWAKNQLDAGRSFKQVALLLKRNFNIQTDLALQLAKGREAFEQYISEKSEKTGSLYDFQVEGLSELSESFNTLWETIKVFKNQLAADLGPVIKGVVDVFQVVVKEVADIWNNLMLAIEEIIGDTNVLSDSFNFLKDTVKLLGAIIKQVINVIEFILMAVKEAGQAVGEFLTNMFLKLQEGIDWLLKKLGFDTRTDEQKYRDELKEKVTKGDIGAEDAVKLLAAYRERQENKKKLEDKWKEEESIKHPKTKSEKIYVNQPKITTKDLITGKEVYLDGTPVEDDDPYKGKEFKIDKEFIEPDEYTYQIPVEQKTSGNKEKSKAKNEKMFPDIPKPEFPELLGNEVVKADNSGLAPTVNLEVSTNATYNEADGTIQQDISINGISKGGSGKQDTEYVYQAVTGLGGDN